jgi:hypothetical protein
VALNSAPPRAVRRRARIGCYPAGLRKSEAVPPQPRWLVPALLCLAALVLAGMFSTEFADPDAWWHLKTGQYILTHRRLPVPDPFAYTTAGAAPAYPGEEATRHFNLTHEWLAQTVMYVFEAAGGLGAVVLWKALILAAMCGFTGLAARLRTGSWLWGVAAALAAASLAVEFAHDRPAILTYAFTAAFIAIFEARRPLWLIPLLSLLWANCHGGFFLGWVVCGAYAAEALIRRAPDRRRLLVTGVLAVLVSGINPNVFGVILTLFDYRRSAMQSTLIEWSRADLWGPPWAFDILLYAAAAVMALSRRRVRPADWLLFAAFAAASLMAFRNELLIGLLAPILIASYFPWKRPLPAVAHYAAAAGLAAALVWGTASGAFFQLRAAEWRYPAGAAAFLAEHRIAAPVFNTYEYGGYLIWRGVPVFIDGRALSDSVFRDYRTILGAAPGDPRRRELLARYGIGALVMNSFEYNEGGLYALALDLIEPAEADWKLVYDDPQAMVFLRDVPPGVPVLDKRRILDHAEAECRLHIAHEPDLSLCARTLGDLALRTGDRERARRALSLYMEHPYPGDTDARRAWLQLMGQ